MCVVVMKVKSVGLLWQTVAARGLVMRTVVRDCAKANAVDVRF